MPKKISITTCLPPDLVNILREAKRNGTIKSLSEGIRKAVIGEFNNKLLAKKGQVKITDFNEIQKGLVKNTD